MEKPRESLQTPHPPPPWTHDAAWSPLFLKARTREERIGIARRWAEAAGGRMVDGTTVELPELPACLAQSELRQHCRNLGVQIVVTAPARPTEPPIGDMP
jgi:hypothetical protein